MMKVRSLYASALTLFAFLGGGLAAQDAGKGDRPKAADAKRSAKGKAAPKVSRDTRYRVVNPHNEPGVGERVGLWNDGYQVPVTLDASVIPDVSKAFLIGDTVSIEEMIKDKRVWIIDSATPVLVLAKIDGTTRGGGVSQSIPAGSLSGFIQSNTTPAIDYPYYEVRILDGVHAGEKVFAYTPLVKALALTRSGAEAARKATLAEKAARAKAASKGSPAKDARPGEDQ